ncbi:MAG: magnesium transporter [Butyrivibrio sp.]|nr:magnesium transporter [Butyrivibrio sp.]MEE3471623.1 magnesium transporter [Butyrivibrio hungatei]
MELQEEKTIVEILKELLEARQYTMLRQTISEMNTVDIAAAMGEMEDEDSLKMFRILPKDMAADVFADLELDDQQYIIRSLSDREASNIIDNLMADDATDLLEEMPASVVKRILANASPETRADINHLLRYPEDSAGSIMTVEYVDLREDMTVNDAIERIRKKGVDSETINICYVVSRQKILVGTVALRYLLITKPDEIIGDIMNTNVISINTMTDQEEAARIFQKYGFTAMPVVDNESRMVGIITIDDVVDIMEEEATEDIEKMAAIVPSDKPYPKVGILETYRNRIPWLLFLMVSATFTGGIIAHYEAALTAFALTAYIPMLMDTGGNAGSQASVSIIRGLSLKEIEFKDLFKIVWKEIRVAVLCGFTLAVANFIRLLVFAHGVPITTSLVVCLTLFVVVLIAKLVGCFLPMLASRFGFDPAVMASPFITTIVDALSLLVFLNIATALLA